MSGHRHGTQKKMGYVVPNYSREIYAGRSYELFVIRENDRDKIKDEVRNIENHQFRQSWAEIIFRCETDTT